MAKRTHYKKSNDLVNDFEDIKYEKSFVDVDTMEDGYQLIPFTFDTTHFAIAHSKEKFVIHENSESITGSFFAPFIECETKEDVLEIINGLLNKFVSKNVVQEKSYKVYIYRYIDKNNKRFFAIGGTNLAKKNPLFHKLNIKTIATDIGRTPVEHYWKFIANEYNEKSVLNIDIQRNELTSFEERTVAIPLVSCSVNILVFADKKSGFNAFHLREVDGTAYGSDTKPKGFIFNLPKIRLSSFKDLDFSINWMIGAFREISGNLFLKADIGYSVLSDGSLDASIAVYRNAKPEETDS